jgi:putative endonuclease
METGKNGEGLAQDYFRVIGFNILECNWRHSRYEIDLIVSRDRILHIVEVKTRGSEVFGLPETAVTPLKLSRLMKAAARYMATHPKWKKVQFDVLSIRLRKGHPPEFFLIEDVYL